MMSPRDRVELVLRGVTALLRLSIVCANFSLRSGFEVVQTCVGNGAGAASGPGCK